MPNKSDSAGKMHQFYSCLAFTQLHKNLAFSSPLQNQEARNFHVNCLDKSSIESLIELGRETAKLFDEDVQFKPTKILDVGEYAGAGRIDETCDVKISNEDQSESYSLKCGKGSLDQILSRNMGSKSLLEKYFDSKKEQQDFNKFLEEHRVNFFNSILNKKVSDERKGAMMVNEDACQKGYGKARFAYYPQASKARDEFLNLLQGKLLFILKDLNPDKLVKATNLILDAGKKHVIGTYQEGSEKAEIQIIDFQQITDFQGVEKRGNDSVKILLKDYHVGFRFKFESGITSSLKLVGDYKKTNNL